MTPSAAGRPPSDYSDTAGRTVVDVIERVVPDWYGPGARIRPGTPMQRRPWSVHFYPTVVTGDGEVGLIVKVPLWEEAPDLQIALGAGAQEATRAEYEMLGRIEAMVAAAADPALASVRPVAYVAEINAIVTERLASRTLRESAGAARLAAGGGVGKWLRRFHDEIGGAAEAGLEPSDLPGLDHLERSAGSRPAALQDAITSILRKAEQLAGRPVRRAVTHGDLGPSNILVTPSGRIAVIDPNLVPAAVEADLAKLAVALRTQRPRLLAGFSLGGRLHPVERAVLEGYGGVSDDVYRLCRRLAAVRRWMDVEEEAGGVRRLALPMARRVLFSESA